MWPLELRYSGLSAATWAETWPRTWFTLPYRPSSRTQGHAPKGRPAHTRSLPCSP